ncbi:hypothetical protein DFH07DRAFT_1056603 [Mycena maculata]|uniref:BTB domain-containing protein n=1 Tax=Mycena maculata TaxID=230809 RepID=A0AAD7K4G2_9AGAR|nr:hypothetical protein DFH07DRAFT_1056603 [Mycena maculata]
MADPNLQNKLQRVEDLWFPDADLILRAENSPFRVHSSILGARSSVFRDMVAFPQPTNAEGDIIDGVPVVRLHDSALETEIFGVDSSSKFFHAPSISRDFSAVIGVMRLAHKYDVQYLFRRALCDLEATYPMEFSRSQAMLRDEEEEPHLVLPAGLVTDLIALHAATVIHEFLQNIPNGTGPCSSPRDCAEAVLEAWEFLLIRTKQGCRDADPLQEWIFAETENDLCVVCSVAGQAEYSSAQLFFWLDMPEIFKLPSWEDLDELRRQVMEDAA